MVRRVLPKNIREQIFNSIWNLPVLLSNFLVEGLFFIQDKLTSDYYYMASNFTKYLVKIKLYTLHSFKKFKSVSVKGLLRVNLSPKHFLIEWVKRYSKNILKIKKRLLSFRFHLKRLNKKKDKNKQTKYSKIRNTIRRKRVPRWFIWSMFGSITTIIFVVLPLSLYIWFKSLPKPELINESITKCTKLLDRKGKLLYEICPEKRSDPIELSLVSPFAISATIAIEDADFYKHNGFKLSSILRAANETFFKKNLQGGSTITQQLVKLSLLSPERTFSRKIKELILAILVEKKYSKDEILSLYLNNTPYGGNLVGIESAAQKFFGKKALDLDLSEASLLAGLPTAPGIYSPFVSLSLAKDRQKIVLDRMLTLGLISQKELEDAYSKELQFIEQGDYIRAPHFVDFVRGELERAYGSRYVNFGGLTVITTLDLVTQEKVQEILEEELAKIENLRVSNGAVVVLSAKTGEIVSMVGSKDYFDIENNGVFNASIAYRQPGSSIKPVTYALALTKGFKTTSLIEDSPLSIKDGNSYYTPVNYDGRFHGKVTLRQALANSYNIPAVKVLMSLKLDDMVKLAKNMGLQTWEADGNYGVSLTLGGKETRLLDLTNAYATFARRGQYTSTKAILKVTDGKGYTIFDRDYLPLDTKKALSAEVSYIVTDILSDNGARLPAFGMNNFLSVHNHRIAVKTGTTDNKRDNYTLGYTPSVAVGVWVGNNDNSPMNQALASGLTGAAPIWNRTMSFVLNDKQPEDFDVPPGVVVKTYPECGNIREVFLKGTEARSLNCFSGEAKKEDKNKKEKKKT
ncbi:MAG: transglycosylase domain-containing protein [Patescibacteria group bacterium]